MTDKVTELALARMAAVGAILDDCTARAQAAQESEYDIEVAAARRGPVEAEVIARAARGRAMCALDPGLLDAAVGRIPRETDRFLRDAVNNRGPRIPIHALVFSQGLFMAGAGRSGDPDVTIYAVFYRLWWIAKNEPGRDENHETLPASEVEYIFGLFI